MSKAKILLAHGILGFGSVLPKQPIHYFNNIRKLYSQDGHDVHCPSVQPLGSLNARAAELETQIPEHWFNNDEPIFMLAHSMGGLDCRRVLATSKKLEGRVRRLITISTPHFGSPVANEVLNLPKIPPLPESIGISVVSEVLDFSTFNLPSTLQWLSQMYDNNAGALFDLKTRTKLQNDDAEGVEYLCIGCDASNVRPTSPVFATTAAIGQFGNIANDGVVSLASASKTGDSKGLFQVWQVDHGGAIGWPSGGLGHELVNAVENPPSEHITRYRKLLKKLIE